MDHLKVAQRYWTIFHKNSEHGISYTVKHFLAFGMARSTIYSIISTLKKRETLTESLVAVVSPSKCPRGSGDLYCAKLTIK